MLNRELIAHLKLKLLAFYMKCLVLFSRELLVLIQ